MQVHKRDSPHHICPISRQTEALVLRCGLSMYVPMIVMEGKREFEKLVSSIKHFSPDMTNATLLF